VVGKNYRLQDIQLSKSAGAIVLRRFELSIARLRALRRFGAATFAWLANRSSRARWQA